jgi:hypothetical protein
LFSPARGLFVYPPILVLAFIGAYRVVREREWPELVPLVAATAIVMAMRFKWFDWWGGYSYGYRPLMDAIVPLTLLVIPAIAAPWRNRSTRALVAVLLAWSIGVQWVGTAYDSQSWDRYGGPPSRVSRNIDDPAHRDRLWSIRDNPIAYYFLHRREALALRDASLREFMKPPVEMRRAD